ncbi:MAG: phosphoribosylaminoimidazolesuccinocarboxamide synthase [Acidobacteriota bacterium]
MAEAMMHTMLPLAMMRSGKVRDVYHLGDRLLIIATDRVSAFDVVLPTPIPDKGRLLTALSKFWMDVFQDVPNHLADDQTLPPMVDANDPQIVDRSMIVDRLDMWPVECVARGYLAGSGWEEYRTTGKICGVELPEGLKEGDRLPEPIYTPARKVDDGHDENITFDQTVEIIGAKAAEELRAITLEIFARAMEICEERGLLLCDAKFEFGVLPYDEEETPILADEVLSPDSSHFWPKEQWRPGGPQVSFDKQYVRQYLMQVDWDRTPPAPGLPENVVEQTRLKYLEAYRRLTGQDFG